MTVINIVLADDHPQVRKGIRNILQRSPDIQVVGEASDGAQALQLVEELEPDVLVLDMEMPEMKGVEVAHKLMEQGSDLPVLALSAYEDRQFIIGMLESGAAGYLVKDEVPEMIIRAIQGIAHGESGWVSRRVAARLMLWLNMEQPGRIKIDTIDIQVLRLFLAGYSDNDIARRVKLSDAEVRRRLDRSVLAVREYGRSLKDHAADELR
jgi:DNA-binding NarL/FixJ family response regulator